MVKMIPIFISSDSKALIDQHYLELGLSKPSKNDYGEFIDYLIAKHLF